MKKVILMLAMLISVMQISAQSISYDDVSGAAKRPKVKFTEYTASNGQVFKVGETIEIGTPSFDKTFEHILSMGLMSSDPVGIDARGWNAEIIKFFIAGSRRLGFFVRVLCKSETGINRYNIRIEQALEHGEIISTVMTSDQALEKLLKAKKLLDLDMMTQEEFNTLKSELAEIIKQ